MYSTERNATEYDILVATAVECLREGDDSLDGLSIRIQRVWPGTKIVQLNIQAALGAAEAAGLVAQSQGRFVLTGAGRREIEKSREWAQATYARLAAGLQARAAEALYPISDAQAELWVGLLCHGLLTGIAAAASAYRGEVDLRGPDLVSPRSIDFGAIGDALARTKTGPDVCQFLLGASLAAVDPSDPFGNELVSTITTGYLLQAFLARRDAIRTRQALGDIRGQTSILDTPVLFQLLGPPSRPGPVEDVVDAAVRQGVEVVVCEHSIEELAQVRRRIERQHAASIAGATQNLRTLQMFRRFVDEEMIEIYLAGFERQDFSSWEEFRVYIDGLPSRLTARGVTVRSHGNAADDKADDLFSSLGALLAERGRERGAEETRRDAETMAFTWRVRREHSAPQGVWPSAWIVTPDTHMSIAYGRVNKGDRQSLTVSPSQWVSVLSAFAAPAQIEELAQIGAGMLAQETMLRVAARYPAAAVVEIVESLTEDTSDTDVRLAQLNLDDMLRDFPSPVSNARELGLAAASQMLELRARRLDIAQEEHAKRVRADQKALADSKAANQLVAGQERALRAKVEGSLRDQEEHTKKVEADAAWVGVQGRRRLIQVVVVVLGASAALFAWFASETTDVADETFQVTALATVASVVIFALMAEGWIRDRTANWRGLLLGLIPQSVTVFAIVRDLITAGSP